MRKRGLSEIVTTVLMVALVLAAAVIVWAVVKDLISEGIKGISFGKFMIDLKIKNANIDGQSISVQVERKIGKGNLTGIRFIFFDGTDSEVITEENIVLDELEEKTFVVVLTELSASNLETVSIAPIYLSDVGENVLGDILDVYYFVSDNGEDDNGGCTPLSDPCGTRVCGNVNNGTCGEVSCGTCASGTCVEGVCEGCTPLTCPELGYNCEIQNDGCGGTIDCGPCSINETCVGGVCEVCTPLTCIDLGYECGAWDDGCGGTVDCESCALGVCVSGFCETSVNIGVVYSVWPEDVGLYFDSEDLPKFGVDYTWYYINFTSNTESNCLVIANYIIPVAPEEYNKTHIRFSFPTDIQPNDNYEIWQTQEGCSGS